MEPGFRITPKEILVEKKGFLLDMDGTVYLGNRLIEGSDGFVNACRKGGKRLLFLTNNSSRDRSEYSRKLSGMGISAEPSEVLTSGEATAVYLADSTTYRRVYVLGTESLRAEFESSGFELESNDPEAVVVGFDMELTYDRLRRACYHIRNGVPFFATHPDINCPTEEGPIPDCGSILMAIEASTGLKPKIIGKPHREMVDSALAKMKLDRSSVAMVGDRLYTDVAMGKDAGITSVLVLSGEATLEDVAESSYKPDVIVDRLADLTGIVG